MERWKEDFIIGLRQGKPIPTCAMLAGLPVAAIYDAREEDPVFSAAWDAAKPSEDAASDTAHRALTPAALEALLWAQCDDEEAAAYFGMELGEFKAAVASDTTLAKAYKLGPLGGKAALKRAQFEKAMSGDGSMQTWMGKQLLGQSDKVDTTVRHEREEVDAAGLAKRLLYLMEKGGVSGMDVIDLEPIQDEPLAIEDNAHGA